jgi:N-acyl-D-aspartate/D-glutamate deacylase
MAQHDLVIRAGTVIDGLGRAARTADVAIQGGRIVDVGRVAGAGRREIDAAGALVTPGFVDIHTHYDGQSTWASRMAPSCYHGVTTAVMGNCGVGFAPVRTQDHGILVELMEGVEDIPGAALHEGLSWEWESFPDFLDYLAPRQFDIDVAAQLPHAAMRVFIMGERGANREPATADDLAAFQRITAEAMRAGAIGFTSSRSLNHRSSKGAPTPSLTAEHDELVAIARGLRDAGRGVLEFISDFVDLDYEFGLLRAMVRESGRPLSLSLAQGLSPNSWRTVMDRIEAANAEGLVIRGQVAPRPIGVLLGLTTTLNPFTTRPSYSEIARLPLEARVQALRDPARRERILGEETSPGFQRLFRMMAGLEKVWVLGDPPNYEPDPADSLAARARRLGRDPFEFALDVLLERDGRQILFMPFANYADNNLDCCREMLLNPWTVPGLGDGGAHVGTICDASFTTTLLTHWGRDRTRGELIDLPTLIRRQTHDTARAVDLHDRGTLEPGMKADINVIDFANLRICAPEMVHDLPAGGARLEQKSEGYLVNVVAGEVTYERGEATGALPGRLVR